MNTDERGLELEPQINAGQENQPEPPMNAGKAEPQINTDEHGLSITEKIIGCCYTVANTLGCGFLEKVYENALTIELRRAALSVEQQKAVQVRYQGVVVGEYVADLLVEDRVLVELKVAKQFDEIHLAQCLNYLKATRLRICLLVNFGNPKLQIKRVLNGF